MISKTNPYLKISFIIIAFLIIVMLFFYNSKSDVEKCADNKLRLGWHGYKADEAFLKGSLKEKFEWNIYALFFQDCEIEKKKTPETFKNKYR